MDAQTEITLDQFYTAVVADIQATFPGVFSTVEFDREDRKNLPVPACLLEISEFDDAGEIDPGTGQWATRARIEARIVLGFREPAVKLETRKLATALAVWLRKRRFTHPTVADKKLPTGPAEVVGAYPDDFDPELDKYEVWRVDWLQVMHLGASVWDNAGNPWGVPLYSWVPEIGFGNEGKYKPVLTELSDT